MSFFKFIILISTCFLLVGCLGGGSDSSVSDNSNNSTSVDDPTTTPTPDTEPNPDKDPDPENPPIGPQPGDLSEPSEGIQGASYPEIGTTMNFDRNFALEPRSDSIKPIIAITYTPAPYIPNTSGTIQLWAADDIGGSGLKKIECKLDDNSYGDCDAQVNLSQLNEGLHTLTAKASDYDNNNSGEVSYTFYVDTTPPQVLITQAPSPLNNEDQADFQFSSSDEGSGVSHYECKINDSTFTQCSENETLNSLSEGHHSLTVRSVDSVGNKSSETNHIWIIDRSAPTITINKRPAQTVYTGTLSTINFSVSDTYSPTGINTSCTLNATPISCVNNQDLNIPTPSPTSYVFSVTATDALGNSASLSINWQSVNISEQRSTFQTIGEDRPVDILFVVDNSGSMDFERQNLAERIDGMINKIEGLDWQIAVTSTDMTNNDYKSDGRLLEFEGMTGQYILTPAMDPMAAQYSFGQTIQNFGNGSGNEEGILASKKVIERALAGETPHNQFIRDGADLSIVVLSDEDEASNGNNLRVTPQQFVNFVTNTFGGQKNMVFHSIISRPGDTACANGEGYNIGNTYDELSRLTGYGQLGGAIIGSVCEMDYTSQLADIGQSVKDLRNSINLDCNPFDSNNDGTPEVTVFYRANGGGTYQNYSGSFQVQNNKLIFDELLPPGDYRADYQCRIN